MAFRDTNKQKLSQSILEMKFMKRSKEKAQKEKDAEESGAMFADVISEEMKHGVSKFIMEPSFVPCEDLIIGRLSYHGMNPVIESLMEAEETAKLTIKEKNNEVEVSDLEMAQHFTSLVGTMKCKLAKGQRSIKRTNDEPRKKKPKFLKPSE